MTPPAAPSSKSLLDRIGRITSGARYVPELDGIRLLALAPVLIQHIYERVVRRTQAPYPFVRGTYLHESLVTLGETGVMLFFALSGFVLCKLLVGAFESAKGFSLRDYVVRRLTRLEPPYFVVMTGILLFLLATGYNNPKSLSLTRGDHSLTEAWMASLLYVHIPYFGVLPKLNPAAWSLEVEIHFYFIAPILVYLLFRRAGTALRQPILIGLIVLAGALLMPATMNNGHTRKTLLHYLPCFLVGFSLFDLSSRKSGTTTAAHQLWLDLFGFGGFCLLLVARWAPPGFGDFLKLACLFLILAAALHGNWFRRMLQIPVIATLGGMVYSIYLINMPILEVASGITTRFGRSLPFIPFLLVQGIVLAAIVIVVSVVFYLAVERPCMRRGWHLELLGFFRSKLGKQNPPAPSP